MVWVNCLDYRDATAHLAGFLVKSLLMKPFLLPIMSILNYSKVQIMRKSGAGLSNPGEV